MEVVGAAGRAQRPVRPAKSGNVRILSMVARIKSAINEEGSFVIDTIYI